MFQQGVVAAILYFGLPQGWFQKHQGNASCDFDAVFISAQTLEQDFYPCFRTGLGSMFLENMEFFSRIPRVLP